jgi:hypothetical protein
MQNFCDYAKRDIFSFEKFVKFTNLPPYNSCPVVPKVIVQRETPIFFFTKLSRKVIKLTDLDQKVSYLMGFRLSELKLFHFAIFS